MTEPVKIVIPPSVAAFLKPDTPKEERLRGAGGISSLQPREEIMLLFCLSKDSLPEVRETAISTFTTLPEERLLSLEGWDSLHPAVLHHCAQLHGAKPLIRNILLSHPLLADATRTLLLSIPVDEAEVTEVPDQLSQEPDLQEPIPEDDELSEDKPAEENEDGEEFFSKYQLAQVMGIGEKIKMALTGDKEWRKILVKDSNKLVSGGVLKNPRITEPEVLNILKSGSVNDEIMRLICANKEWVKNYPIRKALIDNPKTPLANALRFLGTLNEKDVAGYAKSRNVSSVISTQAKRMLLNKKR